MLSLAGNTKFKISKFFSWAILLNRFVIIGIEVDIIQNPSPDIIFVAAPVSDCFTIDLTGFLPVPV